MIVVDPDLAALIRESRQEAMGTAPPREELQSPSPAPPAAPTDNAPATGTPAIAPETEDRFTSLNPDQLPENLRETYRSMQGDYTRKMQEIAENRKRFEGVPEPTIEFARAVEAIARENPLEAARILEEQAATFKRAYGGEPDLGAPSPEATYDPWGQDEGGLQPQSPVEAYVLQRMQQMERAEQSRVQKEQVTRIQSEMQEVVKLAGTPLALPDQVRVIRYATERNITLQDAYRLLHWETLSERERVKAREEGMTAALARQGLPPTGGGLTGRESVPAEPTDVKDIAKAELRRLRGG